MSSMTLNTIPQMSPTNVLITTITIQAAMVYLPNILNSVKYEALKKSNNTLNTEKSLKW